MAKGRNIERARIGALGAATITPDALVAAARAVPQAEVVAVAARDLERAAAFSSSYGIPRACATYQEVIADPGIDAVYIALPNSLHAPWTLKALRAGKHVLCEKLLAANAAEAAQVACEASRVGAVVMEAMHYRYHPLAARAKGVLSTPVGPAGGQGRAEHIACFFSFPLPTHDDIRYSYELAGGATMDAGCYAVDCARFLGGEEASVTSAVCLNQVALVDHEMTALLGLPGGGQALLDVSIAPGCAWRADVHVVATHTEIAVRNVLAPRANSLWARRPGEKWAAVTANWSPEDTTYVHQLRAFVAAVIEGHDCPTSAAQAAENLALIDDIYTAAGLPLRSTAPDVHVTG